jgi:exodeoxyribonuclease VII small subunit
LPFIGAVNTPDLTEGSSPRGLIAAQIDRKIRVPYPSFKQRFNQHMSDSKNSEHIADPKDFERSMQELEALVDQLEQGDLTLEQSLAAFERGINLTRTCQQALDTAEQRVRILSERSETTEPEQYPNDVIPNDAPLSQAGGADRGSDE